MGKLITDGTGRVVAFGGNGLAPEAGQTLQETELTLDQFRAADNAGRATGQPYDVTCDGKVFGHRNRAASATETDSAAQRDVAVQLQSALDGWATLTAPQKDALLRLCVRGVLRLVR